MEPVTAAYTALATKKAVDLLVQDLHDLAKSAVVEGVTAIWTQHANARKLRRLLAERITATSKIKTILRPGEPVDLLSVYLPTEVALKPKNAATTIGRAADFAVLGNAIIVQGTVGQGKSMLMRYLATVEVHQDHRRLPLFIELRNLPKAAEPIESLYQGISTELQRCGLASVTRELVAWLLETGRLLLLFDAFDEIGQESRAGYVHALDFLQAAHPGTQIVVSSRPDSGIETSTAFRTVRIAQVSAERLPGMVSHMYQNNEAAMRLVEALKRPESQSVTALLTTPLLVALLVVRHSCDEAMPDSYAAFYDDLFSLLLTRHDRAKMAFRRDRTSGLSDPDLQRFFDALSYIVRRSKAPKLTYDSLVDAASSALRAIGRPLAAPDRCVDDIVDITCLILREGSECRYVHQSVQEFHSARFLSKQLDEDIIRFYASALRNHQWTHWRQELLFLEQLDERRFWRLFGLPRALEELGVPDHSSIISTPSDFDEWSLRTFGDIEFTYGKGDDPLTFSFRSPAGYFVTFHELVHSLAGVIPPRPVQREDGHDGMLFIRDMYSDAKFADSVKRTGRAIAQRVSDRVTGALNRVSLMSESNDLFELS